MLRRRPPDYANNHERWLVSYADFITLLFAFFVVLYATSQADINSYENLSTSILESLEGPIRRAPRAPALSSSPGTSDSDTVAAPAGHQHTATKSTPDIPTADPQIQALAVAIQSVLEDYIATEVVAVGKQATWVELTIPANMVFPSASRVFLNGAIPLVQRIADILKTIPNEVSVESHTASVYIDNGLFPSNWELSSARAAVVVRRLTDMGVAPERLSATGYAGFRPVADNDSFEGQEANQRIIISIKAEAPPNPAAKAIPLIEDATTLEDKRPAPLS
ncbi:MAG: flagellar motor protein MotB [Pseudomonadota bacterium]